MEDDRERIFGSIRRGLRGGERFTANRNNRSPLKEGVASDFGSSFGKFSSELATLGGEAAVFADQSGISDFLLARTADSKGIFVYEEIPSRYDMTLSQIKRSRTLKFSSEIESGYDRRDVAAFDSVILPCIACISETGTVVLQNNMRLPAALATKLFIVADPVQLIPSLDELFTARFRNFKGSNLFLITGPSRTADIEKVLVTGVHGPKEVYVIFLKEY